MKIVHLCLGCFYPDNHSYQENMLPKFHKQLGYDVEVIASLATFDKDGKGAFLEKGSVYENEYGIQVTRLDYKKPLRFYRKMKRFVGAYEALDKASPDILFIHGCQFLDIDIIVSYLKIHPNVIVYVDNHADFSNSATNWFSKNILHKLIWRHAAQMINPYTKKFYGVLPARVDFLKDVYDITPEKCELLVMGVDNDIVERIYAEGWRKKIREQYQIADDEFLIMTGGKIDQWKRQILLLMKVIHNMDNLKVKLIVFGSVVPELKEELYNLVDGNRVQYIGWIKASDSYKYWAACDLAVFPGRHSVYWEQVAGMGIPMICKYWEGTTHIDVGGNVKFLEKDSIEEIQKIITNVLDEDYEEMFAIAQGDGKKMFSYETIARKAIEKNDAYEFNGN